MPSTMSNSTTSPSFLETDEMGERAADLAGADQRDLVTRHGGKTLELLGPRSAAERGLSSLL